MMTDLRQWVIPIKQVLYLHDNNDITLNCIKRFISSEKMIREPEECQMISFTAERKYTTLQIGRMSEMYFSSFQICTYPGRNLSSCKSYNGWQ